MPQSRRNLKSRLDADRADDLAVVRIRPGQLRDVLHVAGARELDLAHREELGHEDATLMRSALDLDRRARKRERRERVRDVTGLGERPSSFAGL